MPFVTVNVPQIVKRMVSPFTDVRCGFYSACLWYSHICSEKGR